MRDALSPEITTRDGTTPDLALRIASFVPSTLDGNTVEAILSTSADVQRSGYIERLGEWGALPPRIPLLDSHRRDSVDHVIGYVDQLRNENGTVRGVVHISDSRPDIRAKVADGSISGTSIGFSASWRDATESGRRYRVADQITLHEASLVVVPADNGARLRALAATVGVPDAFVNGLSTRGLPEAEIRSEVIREAARVQPRIDHRAHVTHDSRESLVERMADGLLARIDRRHTATTGREFATATIADLARRWLQENGQSTFGSGPDLVQRALGGLHTTSDFGTLFSETFNRALLVLRTQPSPVRQLFRSATATDFRTRHIYEMTDGPALLKVNEHGEIKSGTITPGELSAYKIDTYGRIFGLTFQALVNDDIGALTDISGKMTRGARAWFDGFLIDTIIRNPPLADGKAVFHADHGNLSPTPAAPSDASIGEGKLGMRLQTDASGVPLNAAPKYIVTSAAMEQTVDALLVQFYPPTAADAEPAARGLEHITDPRFDHAGQPLPWYLFADPSLAPTFEYSELSGYEGPRVESRQGFDVLGVEWRVVWHLGAGAVDSRGAWKNPGALPGEAR